MDTDETEALLTRFGRYLVDTGWPEEKALTYRMVVSLFVAWAKTKGYELQSYLTHEDWDRQHDTNSCAASGFVAAGGVGRTNGSAKVLRKKHGAKVSKSNL